MTEPKKPSKGSSGEHPIVIGFRKKLESFGDHTLEEIKELSERLKRLDEKSDRPPPHDPRREDDDEIPVDQVDLPTKGQP